MTSLETVKRAAHLLESRDIQGFQAMLADDFIARGAAQELNKSQALGYLQIFFAAFPDHRFNFTNFTEKGDEITCTGQETGTHLGLLDLKPFGIPVSLPATGRSYKLPISVFTFRVSGEKLTGYSEEATPGAGMAGILEQLGIKPS